MELHINGANIFKENPVTATILQNPINARAVFSRQSIQINNILYIYMHAVEQILLPTVPCKPGLIPHSRKLFANE